MMDNNNIQSAKKEDPRDQNSLAESLKNATAAKNDDLVPPQQPQKIEAEVPSASQISSLEYHRGGPGTNLQVSGNGDERLSETPPRRNHPGDVYYVNITDSSGFHVGDVTKNYFYTRPSGEQTDPSPAADNGVTRVRRESHIYATFCRRKMQDRFVETRPYKEARDGIKGNNSLLIVGGSGDGKTAVISHLATNALSEFLPIPCNSPKEIKKYIDLVTGSQIKLLFVVDDPFGGSYLQRKRLDAWISLGKNLEMYIGEHKFLFATRKSVWKHCKILQKSPFFSNTVDVTSDKLTVSDKRKLIEKYLGDSGKLASRQIEEIACYDKHIAYNQCCKLMGDAVQKGQSGEELAEIFKRPYSFLISELEELADIEKAKYATLCLVALSGGKLRCRDLAGTLSDVTPEARARITAVLETCGCTDLSCGNLQDCAEKLIGTFLEKRHETEDDSRSFEVYTFSHDSIHEAVIMEYGKRQFLQCLNFLHGDVIVKTVRPQHYQKGQHEFILPVPVDVEYDNKLAEVFTEAAIDGQWGLYDVFQNPYVREEAFQEAWVEYLKTCPDKLSAFIRSTSWDDQCIYHVTYLAGAFKLWRFLVGREHIIGNCTCRPKSSPLSVAASRDDTDTVRRLMVSQEQADAQIGQAVVSACENGSTRVLKMLLQEFHCERLKDTMERGLYQACGNGHREIVQYLLETCYTPCRGEKCGCREGLVGASWAGQTDILVILFSHGADVNSTTYDGKTCLHRAAEIGHRKTIQELLARGVKVNLTEHNGWTSLHRAANKGHADIVRELIAHGAQINVKHNQGGNTPLHLAANIGHAEMVQELITHGADINVRNNYGVTCLHNAAYNGHIQTLLELIKYGADRNIRNQWNKTPLDDAKRKGHAEIVGILENCGDDEEIVGGDDILL